MNNCNQKKALFSTPTRLGMILVFLAGLLVLMPAPPVHAAGVIWYVKPAATGTGDCSSWENACNLQSALTKPTSGDEIWVAVGTYKPTNGSDRAATFQLKAGVEVYGGFAGTETDRNQRNPSAKHTILSGDIGTIGNSTDNSYHVVTDASGGATLDGFTITGGYADGDYPQNLGGGFFIHYSNTTIRNVILSSNFAWYGGGMNNNYSSPTMFNVTFSANSSYVAGGGMYNYYGNPTITNASFSANVTEGSGGGIFNWDSNPTITNVTFSANWGERGGGIYNRNNNPVVTNVTFDGNGARYQGGGMINNASSPTVTNVTFSNSAAGEGSGMLNFNGSNPILKNVIIAKPDGINCNGAINAASSNNLIESSGENACGLVNGVNGNIIGVNAGLDPGGLQDHGGSTMTISLLPDSPAINTGTDLGCPAADQRGLSRPQDTACDIGAFEYQSPLLPEVTTAAATNITTSETTLNGVINANWNNTTVTFEYGLDTSYGLTVTAIESPVREATDTTVTYILTGLVPNTTYHYRVVGVNSVGTAQGLDQTFTTIAIAPTVITGAADVTGNSATLNGTVNANGASTNVTFEYGTSAIYGTTVNATQSPLTGSTDTAVSYPLTSLLPNSTYHFRAVGTNTGGTVNGLDATFTTPCAGAITVTNANDNGTGSLRQAIIDVCASGTIDFAADYTILLASELEISKPMTITGVGHNVTISGNDAVRVFYISYAYEDPGITLDNLKIVHGHADLGGGIYAKGYPIVTNSTFSDNSAVRGGGIYCTNMMVTNSTFSNNTAFKDHSTSTSFDGFGGGIYCYTGLSVINSTFSGNSSQWKGGGIFVTSLALTKVINSTFLGNSSYYGGSIYNDTILHSSTASVWNTLIISSISGGGCAGSFSVSSGNNLTNHVSCVDIATKFDDLDYFRLAPLGNYGGPTQTYALLPGSPAIDAGDSATCAETFDGGGAGGKDQRGVTRPAACDIGAFESQGFTLAKTGGDNQSTLVNTAFADPLTMSVTANDPVEPVNDGQITFTPPGSGSSAAFTTNPVTISGGSVSTAASANSLAGTYNVSASASGTNNVDFALSNLDAPALTINDVSAAEGAAGATTFSFTVSLSIPAQPGGVTFDIATVDNSATEPADYAAQSMTSQTISAGSSTYTFDVTVNGDTLVEPDETFNVNVSNVIGATVTDGQGQGTITNDDFVPTVTTNPASAITSTGATLNGAVNSNGASTTVTIEYWLGSNPVTTVSATPSSVTGSTDTAVSYSLTGLPPNTTYTYHVIGTSAVGTTQGADVSFTTGVQAPSVTTIAASAITIDGATLNGTVNAHNDSTTVSFEYGPTASYGTTVTAAESPVIGLTDQAVSYALSGLPPNTLYHYRAVGINSGGTTNGSDRTFTTLPLSVVIATEIHNAGHSVVTFASLLESLHASATVNGNGGKAATGTVTFAVFENPACSGTGTAAGTITLTGGLAEPSQSAMLTLNGLSFRAHYDGDTNYPAKDGICISITTSPHLTVLTLSANALPQDGSILTTRPANLIVQFSRDVLHNSISDTNSAENPVNYLLVAPGVNGVFDTQSCGPVGTGGLKPDDTQITVDSISYDPGTFTAKLRVNNGSALSNGVYRLFICGTTSIMDVAGAAYLNNHMSDSLINFTLAVPSNHTNSGSDSSSDPVTLPATGFAPGQLTILPPLAISYASMGDLWLEIPALQIKTAIVGVPESEDGYTWDVSWLGSQAGWLNGSAFPTYNGNSVITGHVWNPDNLPGLFVNLKQLKFGDPVIIHAFGQVYTYEVRDTHLISPSEVDTVLKHEESAWITLVTCEDFSPQSNQYDFRRIVRAVLINETGDK